MSDKAQIIEVLRAEYDKWEKLLAHLSEEQITEPHFAGEWSIKEVLWHLHAWQQVSLARLTAAQDGTAPALPGWLAGGDPESEDDLEAYNARIAVEAWGKTWPEVHLAWQEGFLQVIKIGVAIPEADLMAPAKYPWLKGAALYEVLKGTFLHHQQDHWEPIAAKLHQRGILTEEIT